MSRRAVLAAALVLLALVGTAVLVVARQPESTDAERPPPTRWVRVNDGPPVDLDGLALLKGSRALPKAGSTVLVNVWASWCDSCSRELPYLAEFSRSPGPVHVVGVTLDTQQKYARQVIRRFGADYPNVVDPDHRVLASLMTYGRLGLPSSVLVRDGRIVAAHLGPFHSVAEIERGLRRVQPAA